MAARRPLRAPPRARAQRLPAAVAALAIGLVLGIGEVARASLGKAHAPSVLRLPEIRLWAAVIASWVVSILLLLISPSWAAGIALTVLVLLGPVAVSKL